MASKGAVFVTGATGTIGVSIVSSFVKAGYKVHGLVRSEEAAAKLRALGGEPVIGDLTDVKVIVETAKKVDGAIHAGAVMGDNFVSIDTNVAKALAENLQGKKFVYTGGCWTLGDTGSYLADDLTVVPQEKSFPFGQNHRNKLIPELIEIGHKTNVHTIVVNPAHVVANGVGLCGLLAALSKDSNSIRIPGSGDNYVSFVHASDVGPMYLAAYEKGAQGSSFLLTGATYKLKDFVQGLKKTKGDVPVESVSLEDAVKAIGFMAHPMAMSQRLIGSAAHEQLGWKASKTTIEQLWS